MNSDIRYLQLLEDDLSEAARLENVRAAARASAGRPTPRRPRRGGQRWPALVAASVALLILAGSIGFLAQGGGSDGSGAAAGGEADSRPAQASPVPAADGPRRVLGQAGYTEESGNTRSGALTDSDAGADQAAPGLPNIGPDLVAQAPGQQQDLSKIVRDGRIEVVVPNGDFDRKVSAVSRIAGTSGGIVLTSSTQDGRAGTFTLRIPAQRFDQAMEQLRGLGTVQLDEITGEDVTAEFIDLQARLQILTDRRDLLRDLQADATSSAEILRFATLIDNTQFEIEKIQGNLNFIRDQVAEATIRVSLREQDAPETEEQQPSDVDNPSLSEALDYATQGFLRVLGAVVVGLGYLVPLSLLALLGWLVYRLVRRRDRNTD